MMKRGGRGRDRGGTFASVVEEHFMIFHRFVCQVRCHFFFSFSYFTASISMRTSVIEHTAICNNITHCTCWIVVLID